MNIKDRKKLVLFFVLGFIANIGLAENLSTAWDYSPVGECVSKYKIPKSTEEYPMIIQSLKNKDSHKNRYLWVWDPTPAKNPTRQLIRVSSKKIGCTILFMPYSEFHDFKLSAYGNIPEKVVSTTATVNNEQESYFFEHEYILDKKTNFYQKIPRCYKVSIGQNKRESVSCKESVEN